MAPIIKANLTVVANDYLKAVSLQSKKNDPFSGSIDTLLETGKAIAPYFLSNKKFSQKILQTWNKIAVKFLYMGEGRTHIRSGVKEIRYIMSPSKILDDQVEGLRNRDLSNAEIKGKLNLKEGQLNCSLRRLKEQGRIEKGKRGPRKSLRIIRRDDQVEKLRKQGLNNDVIEARLNITASQLNYSIKRLISQGRIKRLRNKVRIKVC